MNTEAGYPLLLSVADAADMLGLSRTTIYRLTIGRDLDVVKIGSRSLITGDSIRRLIEKNISA